ncbi:hypothetical protein CLF_103698 [Clonorchis sinensis]|uniref:Uncharacterized protein n=1 Tax=Clonorchis sinensis TaxID=79923 RepID=G7YA84_CLOSI|nr:hypothetical protein CLF_103698 [Clonorchis sinensis]
MARFSTRSINLQGYQEDVNQTDNDPLIYSASQPCIKPRQHESALTKWKTYIIQKYSSFDCIQFNALGQSVVLLNSRWFRPIRFQDTKDSLALRLVGIARSKVRNFRTKPRHALYVQSDGNPSILGKFNSSIGLRPGLSPRAQKMDCSSRAQKNRSVDLQRPGGIIDMETTCQSITAD